MWKIAWCKADCHWLVLAPLGVIYSRHPQKWQAEQELENILQDLAEAKAKANAWRAK